MIPEPRCSVRRCRHLTGVYKPVPSDESEGEFAACAAFPTGIPEEIAYGDNLHTEPYPGDKGIQYEKETD